MTKKQLMLIGGGGHCKACIDVIESTGEFTIQGILDTTANVGKTVLGYPVTGTDEDICRFAGPDISFLITVGQIRNADIRRRLYYQLSAVKANLATVISPRAAVSRHSTIGEGTVVLHNASVGPDVVIGRNCIINTGANIEHECRIGDHVHISTHAVLNGMCSVADGCFVGSNSTLLQGVSLAENILIGAGAVILKPLVETGTYTGNPSRKTK